MYAMFPASVGTSPHAAAMPAATSRVSARTALRFTSILVPAARQVGRTRARLGRLAHAASRVVPPQRHQSTPPYAESPHQIPVRAALVPAQSLPPAPPQ